AMIINEEKEIAMAQKTIDPSREARVRTRLLRTACLAPLLAGVLSIGAAPYGSTPPAVAQAAAGGQLPAPPANGVMGFVVHHFVNSVIQGKDACPEGTARQ